MAESPAPHRFEEFLDRRLPALYRYAMVLTGSPHDAEDLVQEALVRTGAAWPRVRNKDDPERYVRTTMARIMANRWRRRREIPVGEVPDVAVEDPALERLPEATALAAALRTLAPRMRAVLVLRYLDGLTDLQIAEVLGCRPGTVRSQAFRGLRRLREALEPEETRHGPA
jgi:RNA polymerase sigma-70 factor (sigma-E family)